MYLSIIRNDVKRNKAVTLTTMIFIAAAAMLVSLAAVLIVNLSGAIESMMRQAETPHFMQMHSGELDSARLSDFVEHHNEIEEFQILEFLNLEGSEFIFEEQTLADSVQDNGLSVQSEKFDYLLDLEGNVIQVSAGEIYVPLCYMQDGSAEIGDIMTVVDKKLRVAGFLRDSQMNSLLASSKRFLVNEQDFAEIEDAGSIEYLIEFRLKDQADLGAFESAYISADIDANGPTITYPLFKMMNAISDGIMIAVVLLISALVVAIAFLCIRFTLIAKIEDDYREIGVMKAIGLHVSDIKKIYLGEYAALAALGCVLGFAVSFAFRGIMLENIRLYMGESDHAYLALLFGIVSIILVFLAVIAYVNRLLKRFKYISPAEAVRFGISQQKPAGSKRFLLSENRLLGINVFLGFKDVFVRKRLYLTMLVVLVLAVFIIIVPQNLHNTISSEDFVSYMGIGDCDMRIDIQQTDNKLEKTAEIAKTMEQDDAVSSYAELITKTFSVKMDDGTEERLKIEMGDHSVFPLNYAEGRAPAADDEIALSVMNANELEKGIGDNLTLLVDDEEVSLTVSGTYSDVTNGGKTAKATFSSSSEDIMWSVVSAEFTENAIVEKKVQEYADMFLFAKVSGIDEYIFKTFGSTIRSVGKAAHAAVAVSLIIAILITLLFMRMLAVKDRYSIAVMKTFGFTNLDIMIQYAARSIFVLVIAVFLGTLLANTLGETLVEGALSLFGAASFDFVVNPLSAYFLFPLLLTAAVLAATVFGTLNAGRIAISDNIKE
ncbi:MAG: ABC transporter permease [Spirochaetia bacterium]|nr:ABC transporter permease [Spirochaetia bacterium]